MTTDTQLAPTDAELWQLHMQMPGRHKDPIDFARAVLAKWGTPAPVGVEPIGHLYCGGSYGDELADWEIVADQHQCDKLNEHFWSLGKEAKLPIYTTPQPTQPQAGAVPLTQAKVVEAFCKQPHPVQFVTAFDQGVRFAERHHGIKGGQHGAE